MVLSISHSKWNSVYIIYFKKCPFQLFFGSFSMEKHENPDPEELMCKHKMVDLVDEVPEIDSLLLVSFLKLLII